MVHLQCHIGTDTLSLSRLGARSVTGLDFSPASLAVARELAASAAGGETVTFVESAVYSAAEVLRGATGPGFDVVFTGIGAICWLPSIARWAAVVAQLLRPGGKLFIREGHPVLWALDDERMTDELVLRYPYFETEKGNVYESTGTYVDLAADSQKREGFRSTTCVNFNHGLGEIVTALIAVGMKLEVLREWKSVPWRGLAGVEMREREDGEWELVDEGMRETVPLSYTLVAVKE